MYQPPYQQQPTPRPFSWRRWAVWTALAAAATFGIVGFIVTHTGGNGGGSSVANPAVCKAAMAANYRKVMADPNAPTPSEPAACVGLDQKTLERLVGEVMAEYLDEATATP